MRIQASIIVAMLVAGGAAAHAQTGGPYSLTWSTLDCGGPAPGTGNGYALRSTIGQAASTGATGGSYSLQGGFAAPTDAAPPDITQGGEALVFGLHGNQPNPFATTTAIAFSLPKETPVELCIYDMAGRRIRNVIAERLAPGRHQVIWDGRDDAGRRAAHGIYVMRLRAGELQANRKLVVVP